MPLYGLKEKVWLQGVFVLPDGRLLLERLSFNNCDIRAGRWSVSVGVQSFGVNNSEGMKNLSSAVLRRLGLDIKNSEGVQILHLFSHAIKPTNTSDFSKRIHVMKPAGYSTARKPIPVEKIRAAVKLVKEKNNISDLSRRIEVFRIKAFKNITLRIAENTEVKAQCKSEIMHNLSAQIYDEESIAALNIIDAMNVNL